jgi:3-hydroxyisobutyrate dehydrogenase-like beta-hydroxyacid dehydrogenase
MNMLDKGPVGIVGLGIMGGAFAKNLLADGWRVVGYDVSKLSCRELSRCGATIADSAAAVASATPTIITSLPDPEALEATVRAVVEAGAGERVLVETSTLALEDKLRAERLLHAAGHAALDCPVSGTGAQAKTKDLIVYASGDRDSIRRLGPLFAGFARETHDLGEYGNGTRMKFVANLLVAIHNVAAAEALVLGIKAGLDAETVLDLASRGAGGSRILELRGPMMVQGRYDQATMKVSTWQKDMALISGFAQQLRCPTPLLSATLPMYAAAMAMGHELHDTAAVCAVLEGMAGLKRSSRPS